MDTLEIFLDYLTIIEQAAKRIYGDDVIVDLHLGRIVSNDPRFGIRLMGHKVKTERIFSLLELRNSRIPAVSYIQGWVEQLGKALKEAETPQTYKGSSFERVGEGR